MTRVYLVRHGTHGLVDRALVGRMPGVSLSAEGRAEAARVAARFAGSDVARVLSSPLERCHETADAIAAGLRLAVEPVPELTEIDCGDWTGADFDTLAADPRWHAWNSARDRHAIPNGERVQDVQNRVMDLLRSFAAGESGPLVLVSHSDVIKVAAMTLLGAPLGQHDRLAIDPASITTLDLWPGGGKVVRLNEIAP